MNSPQLVGPVRTGLSGHVISVGQADTRTAKQTCTRCRRRGERIPYEFPVHLQLLSVTE